MDEMDALRARIDDADSAVLRAVAERMVVVRDVAIHKKAANVEVRQPARSAAVSERYARDGEALGLDPGFARRLYALLLDEAHRVEDAIVEPAAASPPNPA